jgi:hypothetical protein
MHLPTLYRWASALGWRLTRQEEPSDAQRPWALVADDVTFGDLTLPDIAHFLETFLGVAWRMGCLSERLADAVEDATHPRHEAACIWLTQTAEERRRARRQLAADWPAARLPTQWSEDALQRLAPDFHLHDALHRTVVRTLALRQHQRLMSILEASPTPKKSRRPRL